MADEEDRRCDKEESERWEGVREEEERRSRAWELPGTSLWRLQEL